MKYYCNHCKAEIRLPECEEAANRDENDNVICPLCSETIWDDEDHIMEVIPDNETPAQYEKRTGKPYPENGVVFVKSEDDPEWDYCEYKRVIWDSSTIVVIAIPPVFPPDDWRPE